MLVSCTHNQSYNSLLFSISFCLILLLSLSCTSYVSCLCSLSTFSQLQRVPVTTCSGIFLGFVQTILEKNLVAHASYTTKADVCHFSFSNLGVYISVKLFKFRSLTKRFLQKMGLVTHVLSGQLFRHTHTSWVVLKSTFLLGREVFYTGLFFLPFKISDLGIHMNVRIHPYCDCVSINCALMTTPSSRNFLHFGGTDVSCSWAFTYTYILSQ